MYAGGSRGGASIRPFLFALAAIATLSACGPHRPSPPAPGEEVTLLTDDNRRLAARFYAAGAESPPALIAAAGPGESRSDWEPLALSVQRAGYAVLVFDPRGQGGSRRTAEPAPEGDEASWRAALYDYAAAYAAMTARGADPAEIAVAAADGQTPLAMAFAKATPGVQGLVLVSPALESRGIDAAAMAAEMAQTPILIQFATGDTYAASAGRRLHERAGGFAELREYQGAAQGADLYAASENARQQVVLWLDTILQSNRTD